MTINIPHCDFRSHECSTIGLSVAGTWICRNHVEAALVEKDKEIERLMAQAVRFAEYVVFRLIDRYEGNVTKAKTKPIFVDAEAFLRTPEAQAFQAQQKEGG